MTNGARLASAAVGSSPPTATRLPTATRPPTATRLPAARLPSAGAGARLGELRRGSRGTVRWRQPRGRPRGSPRRAEAAERLGEAREDRGALHWVPPVEG